MSVVERFEHSVLAVILNFFFWLYDESIKCKKKFKLIFIYKSEIYYFPIVVQDNYIKFKCHFYVPCAFFINMVTRNSRLLLYYYLL